MWRKQACRCVGGLPIGQLRRSPRNPTRSLLSLLCAQFPALHKGKGSLPLPPSPSQEFPEDPYEQLRLAIYAVFDSWQSERADVYRAVNGITGLPGTAVNVQVRACSSCVGACVLTWQARRRVPRRDGIMGLPGTAVNVQVRVRVLAARVSTRHGATRCNPAPTGEHCRRKVWGRRKGAPSVASPLCSWSNGWQRESGKPGGAAAMARALQEESAVLHGSVLRSGWLCGREASGWEAG